MSNLVPEAEQASEAEGVALPSERDRELLDYLIERAWQELLRSLPAKPQNENEQVREAA